MRSVLWNEIILLLYFLIKNWLVYRKFPNLENGKKPATISFIVTIATIYTYHKLALDYQFYDQSSFIKGTLPSQTLLFIIADLLASLIFLYKFSQYFTNDNKTVLVLTFEAVKLCLLYFTFMIITSGFVVGSQNQLGKGYWCIKYPLIYELAVYYKENNKFPEKLEDFTTITTNPLNNTDLIYQDHGMYKTITDEVGNEFVNTSQDLMGIKTRINSDSSLEFIVSQTENFCPSYSPTKQLISQNTSPANLNPYLSPD